MSAFTVFVNPDSRSQKAIPYLLDIQNDLLSPLETRVVVPLYLKGAGSISPISRLTPTLTFQGKKLIAMVPELAGVPKKSLGTVAGDLSAHRSEIISALDLLVTGF